MPLPLQSEASLDDEAMMSVDEALGEVFRTRFAVKHQKKQQKGYRNGVEGVGKGGGGGGGGEGVEEGREWGRGGDSDGKCHFTVQMTKSLYYTSNSEFWTW